MKITDSDDKSNVESNIKTTAEVVSENDTDEVALIQQFIMDTAVKPSDQPTTSTVAIYDASSILQNPAAVNADNPKADVDAFHATTIVISDSNLMEMINGNQEYLLFLGMIFI